jgi:hypothetical protein
VQYGRAGEALRDLASDDGGVRHGVMLTGLAPRTRYVFRVVNRTARGTSTSKRATFTTPQTGVADSRLAQWRMGAASGVRVSNTSDGELSVARGRIRGTYRSRVLDAQSMATWRSARLDAGVPRGSTVRVSVRTGSTSSPDRYWSRWVPMSSAQASLLHRVPDSRYIQYRLVLTGARGREPVVRSVGFTTGGTPKTFPLETNPR